MTRTTRATVIVAMLAAVVMIGVLVAVFVTSGPQTSGTATRATPSAAVPITGSETSQTPFDEPRATAISESIASGDPERILAVIAADPGAELDPGAPAALRALAPIEFDLATTRYFDADTGYVQAYAGAGRAPWVVYLVRQDDVWKLAASEEGTIS